MSNLEIKSNAEGTTRGLISIVYYFNLIACIILLLIGIFDVAEYGLFLILAGIIYIFWLTLLKSLFDTFVNISVKLDRDKEIIMELQKMVSLLEKIDKPKIEESKPKNVDTNTDNKTEPVKIDKNKDEEIRSEIKSELDDVILDEIIAGNEMSARLMLMQKKGLSLSAAIAFIEETKNNIK